MLLLLLFLNLPSKNDSVTLSGFHGVFVSCFQALEECKTEPFENHSALEIAEQLTLLDHLVFKVIPYE